MHKLIEGIRGHFLHGNVEKAFVSREKQILEGPWGHEIVVVARRLTVLLIGHACFSKSPFKDLVPLYSLLIGARPSFVF